jgi:hypothetical protein
MVRPAGTALPLLLTDSLLSLVSGIPEPPPSHRLERAVNRCR